MNPLEETKRRSDAEWSKLEPMLAAVVARFQSNLKQGNYWHVLSIGMVIRFNLHRAAAELQHQLELPVKTGYGSVNGRDGCTTYYLPRIAELQEANADLHEAWRQATENNKRVATETARRLVAEAMAKELKSIRSQMATAASRDSTKIEWTPKVSIPYANWDVIGRESAENLQGMLCVDVRVTHVVLMQGVRFDIEWS